MSDGFSYHLGFHTIFFANITHHIPAYNYHVILSSNVSPRTHHRASIRTDEWALAADLALAPARGGILRYFGPESPKKNLLVLGTGWGPQDS